MPPEERPDQVGHRRGRPFASTSRIGPDRSDPPLPAVHPDEGLARLSGLEETLATYAGVINGTHGALVELVGTVLDDDLWEGLVGVHSPAHWLAWRAGLQLNQAKAIVLIARRRRELPATVAALAAGELSLEQARLIAKHAPAAFDASVCNFAKYQTIPQLTRNLRDYAFDPDGEHPDPDPDARSATPADGVSDTIGDAEAGASPIDRDASADEEGVADAGSGSDPHGETDDPGAGTDHTSGAEDLDEAGRASWWWDDNGRCHLHAVLPTDLAMVLTTALDAARSDLLSQTRTDLPPGAAMPWISDSDALLHLARGYLELGRTVRPGTDRYTVFAHLDANPGGSRAAMAHLGPRLPDHLAALITCDNGIRLVWEEHGRPLNAGRTHRTVPDRARRLIEHRDGGCVVPGCTRTSNLDVHHIVHWQDGGSTDTHNLVCLCRRHHRQHHLGKLGISGNADTLDGLTFTDRHGRPLPHGPTPRPLRSDHTPQQAAHESGIETVPYEHGPGMRTDRWAVHLNPEPPDPPKQPPHPPPDRPPPQPRPAGQPPPNRQPRE